MSESSRQEVLDAMCREVEHQKRKWEEDNNHVYDWMRAARAELKEAEKASHSGDWRQVRRKLLQGAAVIVVGLEQRGVVERVECEHEWWISSPGPLPPRTIEVLCCKCKLEGCVKYPSTHEYRQAQAAVGGSISRQSRWYEPERVIRKLQGE